MTNSTNIIQQTSIQLINECHQDYVGLWSVIESLENNGIQADDKEMRAAVMYVIQKILEHDDIVAASFEKKTDRFDAWNISSTEALIEIGKRWDKLGGQPNLKNSFVWFMSKKMLSYQQMAVDAECRKRDYRPE